MFVLFSVVRRVKHLARRQKCMSAPRLAHVLLFVECKISVFLTHLYVIFHQFFVIFRQNGKRYRKKRLKTIIYGQKIKGNSFFEKTASQYLFSISHHYFLFSYSFAIIFFPFFIHIPLLLGDADILRP